METLLLNINIRYEKLKYQTFKLMETWLLNIDIGYEKLKYHHTLLVLSTKTVITPVIVVIPPVVGARLQLKGRPSVGVDLIMIYVMIYIGV